MSFLRIAEEVWAKYTDNAIKQETYYRARDEMCAEVDAVLTATSMMMRSKGRWMGTERARVRVRTGVRTGRWAGACPSTCV